MEEKKERADNGEDHKLPEGVTGEGSLTCRSGRTVEYDVSAEWILLRKKEKPAAEIFHVAYIEKGTQVPERPITFVFNGGPGAASAYLHLGAIGPKRVTFNPDGTPPKPPVVIADNDVSWLDFTDIVFVDPVGTGFSRVVEEKKDKGDGKGTADGNAKENTEYYGLKRDLESLGEFMRHFLSRSGRWESPVYIAGESYGGYRAAKMARLLQEGYGIGLNGAVLISPALEFSLLDPSDYDVLSWLDLFPSMTAAAVVHGKSRAISADTPLDEVLSKAEAFATGSMSRALVHGGLLSPNERSDIFSAAADHLGIPEDIVTSAEGRIGGRLFARTLLKDQRKVCGMYDATITVVDPFPDRQMYEGPDPTLYGIERLFASGINAYLRTHLGLESDRDYHLLSMEVNRQWKNDVHEHVLQSSIGATDDLRYGMAINPFLKVYITHGYFDLVTPYFSSTRISNLMKLDEDTADRLTVKHYYGGHMFYAHEESRNAFSEDIKAFYS